MYRPVHTGQAFTKYLLSFYKIVIPLNLMSVSGLQRLNVSTDHFG